MYFEFRSAPSPPISVLAHPIFHTRKIKTNLSATEFVIISVTLRLCLDEEYDERFEKVFGLGNRL